MLRAALAVAGLSFTTAVHAQQQEPPAPRECTYDAAGHIDHQACATAAPVGSFWRVLALINLGSDAYARGDFANAVRYYDEARPPTGQQLLSDVTFHAMRSAAYRHVGRGAEALADAEIAHAMLRRDPSLPQSPPEYLPEGLDVETVYALILPALQTGDQDSYHAALSAYSALPPSDWISYANRAATFEQLGDLPNALAMGEQALAMAPDEPGALNNQCYILLQMQRASEAAPLCQRAVALAPDIASVRHSMAETYAALGQCEEARRALSEARRLDPVSVAYQQDILCTSAN